MAAGPRKFSLTIQGHSTSLTLEPVFWQALNEAAASEGKSLAALVAEIDEARTTNLSSAVRVWLFERAQRANEVNQSSAGPKLDAAAPM
jgi:predicted DNA-binding ribbon-helix-helix protein